MLDLLDVKKSFVQPDGTATADPRYPRVPRGRRRADGAGRPQRLRQDHPAARHRRHQPPRQRQGPHRRLGHHLVFRGRVRPLPGGADRLRLPDLQPAARLLRLGKHPRGHAIHRAAAGPRAGPATAHPRRPGPSHHPPPGHALGGRAAAGGGRPGAGQQAQAPAWPTSRRPTSTPATSSRSSTCCARPAGKRTWPWCWSPTAPRSPGSSIASRSWRSSTKWEK